LLNLNFGPINMKIPTIFRIGLLGLTIALAGPSTAQKSSIPGRETFRLFTDRNMYIIGEFIRFSAVNPAEKDSDERVLYVEMITPGGSRISGGKYPLHKGLTRGCLEIPVDLLTGYYYVRAYTRTMRNTGPLSYDYVPLTVINPFKSDILASGDESSGSYVKDPMRTGLFEFSNVMPKYGTRKKVELIITLKNNEYQIVKGLCVTVAPENSVESYRIRMPDENQVRDSSETYYSETKGISLTGKLMNKEQKEPVPDQVVTMSVMGDKDFSGYKTDRNGRFFFTLPDDSGKRDIFLSSADHSLSGSSLFIDNDFCTTPVNLPDSEFKLTGDEKKLALKMAVNNRISKEFMISGVPRQADTVTSHRKPFYGEPTGTLFMDKYIQLPTLREYFDEISLEVKIRERKEGKYFKFVSENAGMMAYDPLILVDWVVINDMDKVLALSPQKILRIEMVNKPYVKGNLTYGGIISIISRDGDFAGIDLPASGIFVKYDFFAPACPAEYSVPTAPNIPDARNTLLWIPDFQIVPGEENRITFNTPDSPGRYEILLRGVYPDGKVFGQSVNFEVADR
jgi:hypothetical protein